VRTNNPEASEGLMRLIQYPTSNKKEEIVTKLLHYILFMTFISGKYINDVYS
jgi:hypothetical protein